MVAGLLWRSGLAWLRLLGWRETDWERLLLGAVLLLLSGDKGLHALSMRTRRGIGFFYNLFKVGKLLLRTVLGSDVPRLP